VSVSRDRALLLYEQRRYAHAEGELRRALSEDPHDPTGHALLALCLVKQDKRDAAESEARAAIGLGPDVAFAHYAHASVLADRNRYDEAETAIGEAIRLDPSEPMYFALDAAIQYDQERWKPALAAAERGLALDPEHPGCINIRAMALGQLGRRREAESALEGALAKDPENPRTHATHGWALLRRGDHQGALAHFREALRLDPEQEWARQGIVEALKAKHAIYRVLLRYFTWMSTLSDRGRWAVILGGYFGYRIVANVAATTPALQPLLTPVIGLYIVFALMTWIGPAVFDTLLRLNRFGRLALSSEQRLQSNLIGGALLVAVVCGVTWIVTGGSPALTTAVMSLLLTMPLAATFRCQPGWPRRVMAIYTASLGALAIVVAVLSSVARLSGVGSGAATTLFILYLAGAFISQWVGNYLVSQVPRR
jgi:Flp pilus assembly protein TadD